MFSKNFFTGIALVIAMGAVSAVEPIGEIALVDGIVLKSEGTRFVGVREGMVLRQLDRVMTTEGSTALLAFNDGCRYEMSELELLTLTDESTCRSAGASSTGLSEGQANRFAAADRTVADSDGFAAIERSATGKSLAQHSFTEDLSWLPPGLASLLGVTAVVDARSSNPIRRLSP